MDRLLQGFSLHVRKSLIFIKRSDEWIDIALIIGDKSGSRALWACFFPQSQDYAAEQGQIGCGVACAASALVFKEGGISGVMVFIFDIPSESDVLCGLS